MNIRTLLPSLATISALGLLGISSLFLQDSINRAGELPPSVPALSVPVSGSSPLKPLPSQPKPTDLFPVINRPLFSPSRRIPEAGGTFESIDEIVGVEAPVPIVEHPPLPAPKIIMIGILEDGARLMALVRGQDGNEKWVNDGANIEGWRVVHIAPQSITLQLNGESVDIYSVD